MFVLADIEWVTDEYESEYPTQLAAVRVDEGWNETDSFSAFIRPKNGEAPSINHIAYRGGKTEDFLNADTLSDVLTSFEGWLSEEDIIVWWHYESNKVFRKICRLIWGRRMKNISLTANQHVYAFLAGKAVSQGNIYKIVASRGVDTKKYIPHFSLDDVRVMRELLRTIDYPQPKLLEPVEQYEKAVQAVKTQQIFAYKYDSSANTIHRSDCQYISGKAVNTVSYRSLKKLLGKGYKPCDCCKKEYNDLFRERNADIISRTRYNYVYSPLSGVFHKPDCKRILSAKKILGTEYYQKIADTGRVPCKICNPQPQDELEKRIAKKSGKALKKTVPKRKNKEKFANHEERKAVMRQRAAIEERDGKLKIANLSDTEKHDIYTLTHPGYAFWVGRGYRNFHLRTCSKMQGISNLKGFGTYNDAVRAGYTPCRHCKPTAKHDVKYSIPITSRKRIGDTVRNLEEMCEAEGYIYTINEGRFCLETSAGKWRILLETSPLKLEHINLIRTPNEKNYHEQPRLFLSLSDVFNYIKRHDEELLKQKEKGRVYLKINL